MAAESTQWMEHNVRINGQRTNAKWKQLKISWQRINHFGNYDLLSFHSAMSSRCDGSLPTERNKIAANKIIVEPPPKIGDNDINCVTGGVNLDTESIKFNASKYLLTHAVSRAPNRSPTHPRWLVLGLQIQRQTRTMTKIIAYSFRTISVLFEDNNIYNEQIKRPNASSRFYYTLAFYFIVYLHVTHKQ